MPEEHVDNSPKLYKTFPAFWDHFLGGTRWIVYDIIIKIIIIEIWSSRLHRHEISVTQSHAYTAGDMEKKTINCLANMAKQGRIKRENTMNKNEVFSDGSLS